MADETGLPELLDALRWRWKPTALVALPFFLAAALYVETLPSEYDAKAVVAFAPRPDVSSAGADTVRVVVPKYIEYATAPATAEQVAEEVGLQPEAVERAVDASVATDTGTLTIIARRRSPERAAEIANAVADEVVDFARRDPVLAAQEVVEARPPRDPAAPPRRLLEAAALLVGLLLGVAVSLLIERGRPRLRSWRDMAKLTGYPVVGRVPNVRAMHAHPREAFADPRTGSAFRTLRANLEPHLRDGKVGVVVVTSPQAGDGKTTVAALLAESLSRLGLKTLLVDADLRRPRIARFAELNGDRGLASLLRESSKLSEAVQPGWIEGLSVLPTSADANAGDLLARRFADVVAEARKSFDVIVVDTPPLLATDDARTVAAAAQGTLLVVSAGSAASSVNEAVLTVETLNVPLLGVVGNRLQESKSSYY
ncbi:MAG: polysaccharide biosynthesis tyrosine autokinase [Gaiellaceae bacterium]